MVEKLVMVFFITNFAFSKNIIIKDCIVNKEISNVIVYDMNNNIIGISNNRGSLDINNEIKEIKINHPKYGTNKYLVDDVICLEESLLDEISIETGDQVKQDLIFSIKKSFDKVKDIKEVYFQVENEVYSNNGLLESYNGVIKFNFKKNNYKTTFYNSNINLTSKINEFTNYSLVESFKFVDYYIPKYTLFNSNKEFRSLLSRLNKSKVSKSENKYFIYLDNDNYDDFIVFEVDMSTQLINRYTNSTMEWIGGKEKDNRKLVNSNTDIIYNFNNIKEFQKIQIKEKYIIENKEVNFIFKGDIYNGGKKTLTDEKSSMGFVLMYMKKFTNK